MIVAVTGLAREARLIAGRDIATVVSGGNAPSLARRLACELAHGAPYVLSIGICGALSPELCVGDVIIASEIITAAESYPTDKRWTGELARRLPGAVVGPLAGIDAICSDPVAKALLRAATNASAADMESHVAARAAASRNLPFAALRVVSDPAHRKLPPAAHVALLSSGEVEIWAVIRSILRSPLQIPALFRTAWEAETAFAALLRCRRVLDGRFGPSDLVELPLDMG